MELRVSTLYRKRIILNNMCIKEIVSFYHLKKLAGPVKITKVN